MVVALMLWDPGLSHERGGRTTKSRRSVPRATARPPTATASVPSVSADGRFVAFSSGATNLVPSDTNSLTDAFVKDRVTSATTRVSVTTSGQQLGLRRLCPRISANGRFVMFETIGAGVPDDT